MRLALLLSILVTTQLALADDPIHIDAPELAKLDNALPDGGLPPVVGVRNIQVFRASRDALELSDGKGWTYNHHQDMACWKGRLYVAWTNGEVDEDVWPSREVYSTSEDGVTWSPPCELFPQGVSTSLRMYFFHAPNGRMLVIAGQRVSEEKLNEQTKRGAVVREIRADHSLGDVFTLILDPVCKNPASMFDASADAGFVEACRQLLANHFFLETQDYGVLLGDRRMKWYDLLRSDRKYRTFGKAFSFFHRKDGALVGIGKKGWTIVSTDEGASWSQPVIPQTLLTNNAKVWSVRTRDNRYALVYNPKDYDRYPLIMVSGDDGINFKDARVVHGEVPRQRYAGLNKNIGPQYVRGISQWATDGSRKDDALWVVYSVNKEDIWVSRIPAPQQTTGWSTYSPKWAPVTIGEDGSVKLESRDPYDYAKATYTFPEAKKISVSFKIDPADSEHGPVLIDFRDKFGGEREQWKLPNGNLTFQIDLDATARTCRITVDGKPLDVSQLQSPIKSFQRLSFQTLDWRGVGKADPVPAGSDKPIKPTRFIVRDLSVK
jgi:sialidase-like protein